MKTLSAHQKILLTFFPVILFTIAEEWGGLSWALILSVVYAVAEVGWEWWRFGRVTGMTLFSNVMVVGLSAVSYGTQDGVWFKMQPAVLELVMAVMLVGSWLLNRPLLLVMAMQHGQNLLPIGQAFMKGLTLRLGFFLFSNPYWQSMLACIGVRKPGLS